MKLSGWGRFPVVDAEQVVFGDVSKLTEKIKNKGTFIPFGNGKSYGDSALATRYVPLRRLDRMLSFDKKTGLLTCEAGVMLSEIVDVFLPEGWFLKVTPGTKLITVGGAIAADVHGKNHHVAGCFSNTVENFLLMLPGGETVSCSRSQNRELFLATCGGMGLTGIILQASFYLKPVSSKHIDQLTVRTQNLQATFDAFEQYSARPYSVAWIDCLAKQKALGRSLLMVGDFAADNDLRYHSRKKRGIPFDMPCFLLNRLSVKAFNSLYYSRIKNDFSEQTVDVDTFFYPLDAIDNWNRIYGKNGFVQYQFILPKENSFSGLEKILDMTARSGMAGFLAVLKLYGPANSNYLSFPLEGYSLALDFKIQPGLFEMLDSLDRVVTKLQGRIYLAKDARLSRENFDQGYPQVDKFRSLRTELDLNKKFKSLQSTRLGL